ncbi:MAG TPA: hypothetical protein VNQ14_15310, partial [Woeseiaceae bacterium]|nr:hypothetical protein [Woeseiaceae bacterium]
GERFLVSVNAQIQVDGDPGTFARYHADGRRFPAAAMATIENVISRASCPNIAGAIHATIDATSVPSE